MSISPTYGGETPNYHLAKPALEDAADIGVVNGDFQEIDRIIYELEALNILRSTRLVAGNQIQANDDLNDAKFKVPGIYWSSSGTIWSTIHNAPAGSANLTLYVINSAYSGKVHQLIVTGDGQMFFRGGKAADWDTNPPYSWHTFVYNELTGTGFLTKQKNASGNYLSDTDYVWENKAQIDTNFVKRPKSAVLGEWFVYEGKPGTKSGTGTASAAVGSGTCNYYISGGMCFVTFSFTPAANTETATMYFDGLPKPKGRVNCTINSNTINNTATYITNGSTLFIDSPTGTGGRVRGYLKSNSETTLPLVNGSAVYAIADEIL